MVAAGGGRAASVGARSRADGADRTGIFKDDGTDGRERLTDKAKRLFWPVKQASGRTVAVCNLNGDSLGLQFKGHMNFIFRDGFGFGVFLSSYWAREEQKASFGPE